MTVTHPLVKERPILFSAPMILALLADKKSQTRRVLRVQPPQWANDPQPPVGRFHTLHGTHPIGNCHHADCGCLGSDLDEQPSMWTVSCPYGVVGDRLWVREAYRNQFAKDNYHACLEFKADGECRPILCDQSGEGDCVGLDNPVESYGADGKWKPSIHMPRWASRITLEITDVRVQRLQKISDEDAIAEGCNVRLLRDLLDEAIGKFDPPNTYWDDRDGSRIYCRECGQKECADNLDGGWSGEEDSPPHCEKCGKLLDFVCTDYCMQEEVSHCDEYGIGDSPEDAYVAMRMIHGGGHPLLTESCGEFHFHPEWTGKIAKICFRYLWNKINGEGSWESNPFVWSVSFRRSEK